MFNFAFRQGLDERSGAIVGGGKDYYVEDATE